jgi:hypothetical protein
MNKPNNKTKTKLDQILSEINKATNSPEFPWTTADGKAVPNKGNFHSDYAPEKGYSVYRFGEAVGDGFQISEPIFTGRVPIGTAIAAAQAFLNGINSVYPR